MTEGNPRSFGGFAGGGFDFLPSVRFRGRDHTDGHSCPPLPRASGTPAEIDFVGSR